MVNVCSSPQNVVLVRYDMIVQVPSGNITWQGNGPFEDDSNIKMRIFHGYVSFQGTTRLYMKGLIHDSVQDECESPAYCGATLREGIHHHCSCANPSNLINRFSTPRLTVYWVYCNM